MIPATELKNASEVFLTVVSEKNWYQQEVYTALMGVVLGFILSFCSSLLKEYVEKRRKVKKIVMNLFNEIGVNYTKVGQDFPLIREVRSLFNSRAPAISGSSSIDTPRLIYHGVKNQAYYDLYFKDLDLLDYEIQKRVAHFYDILRGIDARSESIATMFENYYSGNMIVKKNDIIEQLDKLIKQLEAVELLGAETNAIMCHRYKILKNEERNKNDDYLRDKVHEFIKSMKKGQKFNLREISKTTGISIISCAHILHTFSNVKNSVLYGEYVIIRSFS
jgi:hypothetical protein